MIYNKIERVLVITKRILNYYNSNFSLGITSKVQKVNQKYTFTQKLTTKHNFQTPSLTFSSTVTEWNAQDCGILKTAKDTSMLPSKINQMKVSHETVSEANFEVGRALMPSCLGMCPPKSRIFQFSDAAIVYISSNGRPQLLAQGCVYCMLIGQRVSQMSRMFYLRWCEQRKNLTQLFWRDCSWFIGFIKKNFGWIFNIIGWLFSHTAATQLCSNTL